jgi:GMP synthase (glutamine-hydrolysing)
MAKHRVLVVDGNSRETDQKHIALGGNPTGDHYARVIQSLGNGIDCIVIHPAHDNGVALDCDLTSFDGVAWTGSSLNVYNTSPEVVRQIDLARACFAAGVPQFGSCWGLQVATVAAGGAVQANPRGRELGVARHIELTKAGRLHPMFEGKRASFDALAVHMDEVSRMPPDSAVLAGNAMSSVQAVEIRHLGGVFWGTQYHPEFDLNEIATVLLRYGNRLIEARFFADMSVLERFAGDLRYLHADPTRKDLAWLYGICEDVLDPSRHRNELTRWLECLVLR